MRTAEDNSPGTGNKESRERKQRRGTVMSVMELWTVLNVAGPYLVVRCEGAKVRRALSRLSLLGHGAVFISSQSTQPASESSHDSILCTFFIP